jgi:pimeloyl-ACP methyl ester carboxylesterase
LLGFAASATVGTFTSARAESLPNGVERALLGSSGYVRGWSVTAFEREAHDGSADERTTKTKASVQLTNSDGALTLESWFKPASTASNTVVATGRLSLKSDLQGWLLLKVPGRLAVAIDGKPMLRRDTPLAYARGWHAVQLQLPAGIHSVELTSRFARETWSLTARLLDENGSAPAGAQWWLPSSAAKTKTNSEPFGVQVKFAESAPIGLALEIGAPAGTLVTSPEPVTITIALPGASPARVLSAGRWPRDDSPSAYTLHLGPIDELVQLMPHTDGALSIEVRVGKYRVTRALHLSKAALLAWRHAIELRHGLATRTGDSLDVIGASLQVAEQDLAGAMLDNRGLQEIERITSRVERLTQSLTQNQMPWQGAGIHELAWRASADSSLQRFALQAPAHVGDGKPRPLVVVLHGYNGTARHALDAFLDVTSGASEPKVDGYVLAPAAHGNAFYRGPGERDVLEILDWALQALVVDKSRVTITGASMGGTGTAEIAFHYPDRFAALSPLCGYQSYFVRRDTALQPLRQWERKLMHRFSPASSAEAGRYLPMYLAQGLKDKPLENSKVLTARYKELGYSLVEDWPDLGHAVWKRTWAKAGLFPWLSQKQRVEDPPRITLVATALRHGKSHWLNLTDLDPQAEVSRIDAEFKPGNVLVVFTKGVEGFAIGPTAKMDGTQALQVTLDSTKLVVPARTPLRFHREGGVWKAGAFEGAATRKSVHVEGPWSDLWSERLAFVYGSLRSTTAGTNASVARALAAPTGGVDYHYPVVSDREFEAPQFGDMVPILIGSSSDNTWLAQWAKRLPIAVESDSIVLGTHRYKGDRVGAVFVYPNPDHPSSMIGVVTAPTTEGLWQMTLLPLLLPDFTVFDTRITPSAGQPIVGRAGKVLAAGFFNADWSLPARVNDPLDEN